MDQILIYIALFGVIILMGQVFNKAVIPISLILVITGMVLSEIPGFLQITLDPKLVLNVFLPLLVYQISSFSSWPDVKKYRRPIALLSVGHVIFITFLVAVIIHEIIPQLGWPLAFLIGAIVSPPDDVAIVSIAKKIRIPNRLITVLEGEGLLNDAMALTLFRFTLIAVITHEFLFIQSILFFFLIVIGETLYGILLGYVLGEIRLKITDPVLHIIASLITPFIAYYPAIMLGGSGIIATVVVGFIIGHRYSINFAPDFRLVSFAVWPALSFALQSLLFLLVGLDLHSILLRISSISLNSLFLYSSALIATVIIGRFFWVYIFVHFLPRFLFPSIRKQDPAPPWQFSFIVSWAGMRGAISLAAALALPVLPNTVEGVNARDLILFLVFCVIIATFVLQGLTLPWLLKKIGIVKYGQLEDYNEHLTEIATRLRLAKSALHWLHEYRERIKGEKELLAMVKIYIREYKMQKTKLQKQLGKYQGNIINEENQEIIQAGFLLSQILEVQRAELLRLWNQGKISLALRNKLGQKLDFGLKHIEE